MLEETAAVLSESYQQHDVQYGCGNMYEARNHMGDLGVVGGQCTYNLCPLCPVIFHNETYIVNCHVT
jgi:hypothetical protein